MFSYKLTHSGCFIFPRESCICSKVALGGMLCVAILCIHQNRCSAILKQ